MLLPSLVAFVYYRLKAYSFWEGNFSFEWGCGLLPESKKLPESGKVYVFEWQYSFPEP